MDRDLAQKITLEANQEILTFIEKHIKYVATNGLVATKVSLGFLRKEKGLTRIYNTLEHLRSKGFKIDILKAKKLEGIYEIGVSWIG